MSSVVGRRTLNRKEAAAGVAESGHRAPTVVARQRPGWTGP